MPKRIQGKKGRDGVVYKRTMGGMHKFHCPKCNAGSVIEAVGANGKTVLQCQSCGRIFSSAPMD